MTIRRAVRRQTLLIAGIVAIGVAVILAFLLGSTQPAGRVLSLKPASQPQPFALVSETIQYDPEIPPPANPCGLNEDSFHYRLYRGYLTGTFTATEQGCDYQIDGHGMGGEGLYADLYEVGQFDELSITRPDGLVHNAVLIGQVTLGRPDWPNGTIQYHWQVCWASYYSVSTNTGTGELPGGTWTYKLAGDFAQTRYEIAGLMLNAIYQPQFCPPDQRNLGP